MADEGDSSQEKTEDATPRKLDKAREDGQVARSRELTTTILLVVGMLALLASGGFLAQQMMSVFSLGMQFDRAAVFDPMAMVTTLGLAVLQAGFGLLPLFAALFVAAFVGPIALGGWLVSGKAMMPKLDRMSLFAGIKRMFSAKSLMELFKSIAKVGVILFVAIMMLRILKSELLGLSTEALVPAIRHAVSLAAFSALVLSVSTVIIAMVDVPFQLWDHAKKLKMSTQDVKDEYKDTEGKPEVKGRVRQLQREIANRKMMSAVPEADVVITNPTHYSVALKYDPQTMNTPILLAKGGDLMAMKIREIAREHKIEIIASPQLARSIFHTTDVDGEVPAGLYLAVAQVLAYVFQLRNYRRGQADRPTQPKNVKVPPDLRYD